MVVRRTPFVDRHGYTGRVDGSRGDECPAHRTTPIRVAVLIDGLGFGGAEALLVEFASAASGFDLVVGYLEDKDGSPFARSLREHGITVDHLQVQRLLQPDAIPRVRRWLVDRGADIVHTHLGYSDILGGVAARSLGLPVFSTIHVMPQRATGLRNVIKERLYETARRWCTDRVIAVSDAAREAYLQVHRGRPEQVVAVHNGVQDQSTPGAGRRVRTEFGVGPCEIVVVQVAVLRKGKGHATAITAVGRLRRSYPGIRLLIVGDGPERSRVAHLADDADGGVDLTGHRDDVAAVLDAADVLIHPTQADAFPTALLEAARASVPVISTRVGGVPEIVVDGQTGLLLSPSATSDEFEAVLAELVDDPARRAAMGRAARERYEAHFTARRWSDRTRGLYETALLRSPHASRANR